MAKDPAFLFYSQDFFLGSATMSFEDKGKYIHILCLMHQQGRLDEETIRFSVGNVSVKLKSKFKIDENGFWYNKRLEDETKKRNNFTKSRRDNGSKGGRPKKEKTDRLSVGSAKDKHMGIENENNNTVPLKNNTNTFNTKPVVSDFNGLPNQYIDSSKELVYRLNNQLKVDDDTIKALWEVFKVQHLTGDNWYANEGKVYNHFLNVIKKEKFTSNGTGVSKVNGTTKFNAGVLELLAKGKEEYASIARKQADRT